ncbi:MAG TPA: DegT/DnrJ/EryC1/StrS family aminotransferase [Thermomicrobiales bacterium]|jgi:dTDP-4-amino-4,6-dideoxygalactose transaminase|nr:DegT/DnrJ/EryC1/StrS family aminotransferase [Thermomicrobiales bacterium]
MYIVGQEEIEALAAVIRKGALFRYGVGGECDRFERRYADFLGTRHVALTASGTFALTAAVTALGIGPGDEVLVPAHTYMATAMAVLAAGAIPVIVDVDESITIDPEAVENGIGPRTKAVIPVHMWGVACDMDRIMAIAAKHDLLVLEDVCQAIGGGYESRMLGTIGHAGAFSFNYYKNMTAGEGGAVCTADDRVALRVRCAVDPCHFYWQGRSDQQKPFAGNGARASELMGAVLNVQLDRLPGMIEAMRAEKRQILDGTAQFGNLGLRPTPTNSPDHDCAAQVMYSLPSAEAAERFAEVFPSVIAGKTGRHNYTEWDQILIGEGAAHPAMNPYNMPQNRGCRRSYSRDMCQRSLDILNRTVMVATHPLHTPEQIADTIHNIGVAARVALGGLSPAEADLRNVEPVDAQKFDLKVTDIAVA